MAHQYWRLAATAVALSTQTQMVCAEAEFRATPGGADQCTGGTAISSGITAGSPASNGFDNNSTTNWISNNTATTPWWLGYNFGTPVNVQQVTWQARSTRFDFTPSVFTIQYSDDGTNWTTAWSDTWSWSSNGQINTTTDPAASASSARPSVFVCT